MDWETYKVLCDRPWVVSRWMLEQTRELLLAGGHTAEAAILRASLEADAIAKPEDHRGGRDTDMFELRLQAGEVHAIARLVADAVRSGRTTRATAARGLGGFVEAWEEYRRWIDRTP